jgi:dTDP-4-dehydrorhamnose reductase
LVDLFSTDDQFEVYGVSRKSETVENVTVENVDLLNECEIKSVLNRIKPEIIIHCAANVNLADCENNKGDTYKLHVEATKVLASHNNEHTKFIYISTDSVFDGKKGNYNEKDEVNPLNYYAKSKYLGEEIALSSNKNTLVVRTNIYGLNSARGNSLAEWAIEELKNNREINGFDDVFFNPVYVGQLAEIIKIISVESTINGVLNVGSSKGVSKFQFINELAEIFGFDRNLIKRSKIDGILPQITRPKNTTLNIDKLKSIILEVPILKEGLSELYNTWCIK